MEEQFGFNFGPTSKIKIYKKCSKMHAAEVWMFFRYIIDVTAHEF